jgi:SHS2 domain-containing protein
VKAITYHGLSVLPTERDGGQVWSAEVIVDI